MKTKIFISIIVLVLIATVPWIEACTFEFESNAKSVKAGETFDVKVTVINTHRRCIIEITDTRFAPANAEIVKESDWEEVKRGQYVKTVTLQAKEAGEAALEVIRECSREGRFSETHTIKVE